MHAIINNYTITHSFTYFNYLLHVSVIAHAVLDQCITLKFEAICCQMPRNLLPTEVCLTFEEIKYHTVYVERPDSNVCNRGRQKKTQVNTWQKERSLLLMMMMMMMMVIMMIIINTRELHVPPPRPRPPWNYPNYIHTPPPPPWNYPKYLASMYKNCIIKLAKTPT